MKPYRQETSRKRWTATTFFIGDKFTRAVEAALSTDKASTTPNYTVKNVELVVAGADVQARIFTLAPGEFIPWHYHSESTDHYFVLRGTLSVRTRAPDKERMLEVGNRHQIMPGTAHLISNRGTTDCVFLLLQGVGNYDWLKPKG